MAESDPSLTQEDLKDIAKRYFKRGLREAEIFHLRQRLKDGKHGAPDESDLWVDQYSEILEDLNSYIRNNQLKQACESIDKILAFEGKNINRSSDNYIQLCHYVLRAQREIIRIVQNNAAGLFETKPKDPLFSESQLATSETGDTYGQPSTSLTLTDAIGKYLKEHEGVWKSKTSQKYKANLTVCAAIIGPKAQIASLDKASIRKVKDALLKLPPYWMLKYPDMSLEHAIRAAKKAGEKVMSPGTAKAYLTSLSSFLSWAYNEGHISSNPVVGFKIPDPVKAEDKRDPFKPEHLKAMFNAPIYTGIKSEHKWKLSGQLIKKDDRYWLPLVGLLSGMRLGELLALKKTDIEEYDGISVMVIRDAKTKAGIRSVPIHPELDKCGFLDHVKEQPNGSNLFAQYDQKAFSKHFGRFLDSLKMTNPKLVYHSFRHTFTDALRAARIEEPVIKAIIGHSDGSVTRIYGAGYPDKVLYDAISKATYKGVDFSHLHP